VYILVLFINLKILNR